jgi:hypothetical protein
MPILQDDAVPQVDSSKIFDAKENWITTPYGWRLRED